MHLPSFITNYFQPKPFDETYFTINPISNWKMFNFRKLENIEQCKIVEKACINEARYERLKSYGYTAAAVFTAGAIIIAAIAMNKVAIFIISFSLLPLKLFVPMGLISIVSSDLSAALLAFYSINKVWTFFIEKAQPHADYADHLYKQAKIAELTVLKFI